MKYTDDELFDIILQTLYDKGGIMYLNADILKHHNINIPLSEVNRLKKKIDSMGLTVEIRSSYSDPYVQISPKGVEIMQIYGSYSKFLDLKRKEISTERQTKELTKHNIKLNNWKLSIALIAAIVSLIISMIALIKNSHTIEELKELLLKNNIESIE